MILDVYVLYIVAHSHIVYNLKAPCLPVKMVYDLALKSGAVSVKRSSKSSPPNDEFLVFQITLCVYFTNMLYFI